jgi:hypothetical protein
MMKKDLEKLLDEWQISDAEEFEEDLDNFGEDEVSSDALDRILSSSMKKAGFEHQGAITMNRTSRDIKKEYNTGYGEIKRFRGVAAIAACLAIIVTGTIAAKTMFGGKLGTEPGTQITTQLTGQTTLPDDSNPVQTTEAPKNENKTETETSEPDTSSKEDVQPEGHIDMTPDKIFSMSIEELKELSNNEYDIVESKWSPQHLCYGYRFKAFPEYVCAFDAFTTPDETAFMASDNVKYPPNWIEVDKGVDMGNGVTPGMTYNEIKELSDGTIYMRLPWRWLVCATVEGKQCCFEIEDLTDEQADILGERLESYVGQSEDETPKADASDVDPKTTYGIIFSWERMDVDKWAVDHYKGVDDEWLTSMYDEETLKKYGY